MRRQLRSAATAVTREDVARRAGVSTATVSYVVNGGPRGVSPATRAAVLRAIKELDYKPNRLARRLARRGTQALAFVTPDITNPLLADLARQVEETAFEAGYMLVLCNTNRSPDRERAQIALLDEKRVDGLVVVTSGLDHEGLRYVLENGISIVLLDREIPGAPVDMVLVDNVDIGRQAVDHLREHGHERIACVAGPAAAKRVQGFRESLQLGGLAPRKASIQIAEPTVSGGQAAATTLFASGVRPTAIFASNDLMAVGVLHAARAAGLKVPEDLAVVGADGTYVATTAVPPLTTVTLPVVELGRFATTILLDRIRGTAPPAPRRVTLKAQLTVRTSCGCPAREPAEWSDDETVALRARLHPSLSTT